MSAFDHRPDNDRNLSEASNAPEDVDHPFARFQVAAQSGTEPGMGRAARRTSSSSSDASESPAPRLSMTVDPAPAERVETGMHQGQGEAFETAGLDDIDESGHRSKRMVVAMGSAATLLLVALVAFFAGSYFGPRTKRPASTDHAASGTPNGSAASSRLNPKTATATMPPKNSGVWITATPNGAELFQGESKLGVLPMRVSNALVEAPVTLEIRADGHEPLSFIFTPDGTPETRSFELTPRADESGGQAGHERTRSKAAVEPIEPPTVRAEADERPVVERRAVARRANDSRPNDEPGASTERSKPASARETRKSAYERELRLAEEQGARARARARARRESTQDSSAHPTGPEGSAETEGAETTASAERTRGQRQHEATSDRSESLRGPEAADEAPPAAEASRATTRVARGEDVPPGTESSGADRSESREGDTEPSDDDAPRGTNQERESAVASPTAPSASGEMAPEAATPSAPTAPASGRPRLELPR